MGVKRSERGGVGTSRRAAERTDAARILRASWRIAEELRKLAWPTEARGCGGRRCPWGRHPRLRHIVSPMASPMANEAAGRVALLTALAQRRAAILPQDGSWDSCLPLHS